MTSQISDSRSPRAQYQRRLDDLRREGANLDTQYRTTLRGLLLLAVVACVVLYQAWSVHSLPGWSPLFLFPVGGWVVSGMGRSRRESLRMRGLREYYESALARVSFDWETLDQGAEFIDAAHAYARDLDLFGRGSLFQMLCSARTQAGRETLAAWMKAPAAREEVMARREAIAELRGREDLRERLATAGQSRRADCRPETFRNWLQDSSAGFPKWAPPAAFLFSLLALTLPPVYWLHLLGLADFWRVAAAAGALGLVLAWQVREQVLYVLESVRLPGIELPLLTELLQMIEGEKFTSARLRALTARLGQGSGSASAQMRGLHRMVLLLDLRLNPMFTLASYPLLWATQFAMAIDRWRERNGRDLNDWLPVLGEFEALISLATYANEHPDDVLPELSDGAPEFDAERMGHPLIEESHSVRNDIQLGGAVQFLIVSGSNMSGKSTFLRSIGQNTVLAWMGAPVRCARLRVSRLALAGAIRVQDSLVDGRSHFFAEMQRLRRMIEAAGEAPMLYLADEIMSGTNSHDRRIVAERVVRALLRRSAIGAITTHDLALTEIAANGLPGRNVHFEDRGEGGELLFDYTLREGVLQRSNALNIAQMLGIEDGE